MSMSSLKHSVMSRCLGVASMRMETQSLKIGIVVNRHRIVKMKVQIGSAMCHSGLK